MPDDGTGGGSRSRASAYYYRAGSQSYTAEFRKKWLRQRKGFITQKHVKARVPAPSISFPRDEKICFREVIQSRALHRNVLEQLYFALQGHVHASTM